MADWQLSRKWRVISEGRKHHEIGTLDLMDTQAFCLLGTAGLGKTHELKRLAESLAQKGVSVLKYPLGRIATTADSFERRLQSLVRDFEDGSAIILDGLDEAMMSLPTAGLIVAAWIREELPAIKPRISISCRSTVWPSDVEEALSEVYKSEMTTVVLDPLDETDQRSAAAQEQIEPTSFLQAVRSARADALAQQPLTLKMLIEIYRSERTIAHTRCELFEQGIGFLCHERRERRDVGTIGDTSLGEILGAAERLATYVILSGSESVTLDDHESEGCLSWRELEMLPIGGQQISGSVLDLC